MSAVAQGALGIESREADPVREHLGFLHDPDTCSEVSAERGLLDRLGGDCHVPIGARGRWSENLLKLTAVVASPDGSRLCRSELSGPADAATELGRRVAEELLRQGAGDLLAAR